MEEQRIKELENKVAALETKMAIAETDISYIKITVGKIENNTTWLVRLVIGAILLAILGYFISEKPNEKVTAVITTLFEG